MIAGKIKIGVIGLGYVGLPLACLMASKYPTVGFDIKKSRIAELCHSSDSTGELSAEELNRAVANGMMFTSDIEELRACNFYIITVPTPVDEYKNPDLTALYLASEMVGKVIARNDIVVYESTVYPGATEEECVPVIERESGFIYNTDFFVGYSPERVNPGDKMHTINKIKKVISGSTPETAQKVDSIYSSVIDGGTYSCSSIKVAEAAKVIENAQRDINIAFINELAKIFNIMGIDTQEVLQAAGTKWNFLPFKPGLVGGHCIGVDPYYLAQCAERYGYHPEIILAGRRVNDGMGGYVAQRVIKMMVSEGIDLLTANVLILGVTFKENCPDVRNTRVVDIVKELEDYNIGITLHDPCASPAEVKREYGLELVNELPPERYDAVILAVSHQQYADLDVSELRKQKSVVYDIKGYLNKRDVDGRL